MSGHVAVANIVIICRSKLFSEPSSLPAKRCCGSFLEGRRAWTCHSLLFDASVILGSAITFSGDHLCQHWAKNRRFREILRLHHRVCDIHIYTISSNRWLPEMREASEIRETLVFIPTLTQPISRGNYNAYIYRGRLKPSIMRGCLPARPTFNAWLHGEVKNILHRIKLTKIHRSTLIPTFLISRIEC
jgi:hypothetical protein